MAGEIRIAAHCVVCDDGPHQSGLGPEQRPRYGPGTAPQRPGIDAEAFEQKEERDQEGENERTERWVVDDYEELRMEGIYLAMSPEARGLPGYIGSG